MIIERDVLNRSDNMRDGVWIVFASGQNMWFANVHVARQWLRSYRMLTIANKPEAYCYIVKVKLNDAYREARHNRRLAIQRGQSSIERLREEGKEYARDNAEIEDREKRRQLAHQLADAAHVKSYQARRARDMD